MIIRIIYWLIWSYIWFTLLYSPQQTMRRGRAGPRGRRCRGGEAASGAGRASASGARAAYGAGMWTRPPGRGRGRGGGGMRRPCVCCVCVRTRVRAPRNTKCRWLCRVPRSGTRQTEISPSARSGHSAKSGFAECPDRTLGILNFCRVPWLDTRQSGHSEFVFRNLFEYNFKFHKFLQIMENFIAHFKQQILLMLYRNYFLLFQSLLLAIFQFIWTNSLHLKKNYKTNLKNNRNLTWINLCSLLHIQKN